MFQYPLLPIMKNRLSFRTVLKPCFLAAIGICGCTDGPNQRVAAEMSSAVSDDAQYAIATRIDHIGRIVVPVSINNQPGFHLMLDTGATNSVLTSEAANRLSLNVDEAAVSEVQGVSGRMNAHVVSIDQLQTGTLKLRNLHVPIIDGPVVASLDGILGVDGMGDKEITADFVRDRVRVENASSLPANGLYAVIRFALVSRRLVVADGRVGRISVRVVIDTGGTQTLGNMPLLDALVRAHRDKIGMDSGVVDITDNQKRGRLLLVPELKIGPATITNAAILFSDFTVFKIWNLDKRPTLLMGMDVLGQLGALSINYKRQELLVRAR
ncbi:MAG: retropepsin-like aspartic protease [Steroidobacter sp.]